MLMFLRVCWMSKRATVCMSALLLEVSPKCHQKSKSEGEPQFRIPHHGGHFGPLAPAPATPEAAGEDGSRVKTLVS